MAQVEATATAVVRAMAGAGLADPADVHFVQVKCPLLTSARIAEAAARGHGVATHDTYASMGLSRAPRRWASPSPSGRSIATRSRIRPSAPGATSSPAAPAPRRGSN